MDNRVSFFAFFLLLLYILTDSMPRERITELVMTWNYIIDFETLLHSPFGMTDSSMNNKPDT